MSKVRIQVITVESDSSDPEVWRSIRRLIRRASMGAAVASVTQSTGGEAAAVELGRRGGLKGGPARAESLSADQLSEAAKHAADARWANREPKPVPPAPPRACSTPNCIFDQGHAGECFQRPAATEAPLAAALAKQPAPGVLIEGCRVVSDGLGDPPASPPSAYPARRTEDDIRDIVQAQSAAPVPAPAGVPPMLEDRIMAAITASPGVTAPNLTMALFSPADSLARRRVDMQLSSLQAAGKIMRANGQLFPHGYRGGVAAPPPKPRRQLYPGSSDEETKQRAYTKILGAFSGDNFYSIPKLAEECFGEATGSTVRKVKLMLHQLVANEKLERVAESEYRPFTKKPEPAEDDEGTESNGQPDESEDLEELE